MERLEALGEQLDGGKIDIRKQRGDPRPIAGTRLIREWQGIEHCVTVRDDDFEYAGPALQIAVGDRPRHHRHALERLGVLRAQEPRVP